MSKKTLNVEGLRNELQGASLYFTNPSKLSPSPSSPDIPNSEPEIKSPNPLEQIADQPEKLTRKKTPYIAKRRDIGHASKNVSMLEHNQDDLVETIRKTVKQVGKDTVFIRLTPDEKAEIASVVYTFNELYRGDGRKTSENEVGRIALNFLLKDYRENGELSILSRVLAALNA